MTSARFAVAAIGVASLPRGSSWASPIPRLRCSSSPSCRNSSPRARRRPHSWWRSASYSLPAAYCVTHSGVRHRASSRAESAEVTTSKAMCDAPLASSTLVSQVGLPSRAAITSPNLRLLRLVCRGSAGKRIAREFVGQMASRGNFHGFGPRTSSNRRFLGGPLP